MTRHRARRGRRLRRDPAQRRGVHAHVDRAPATPSRRAVLPTVEVHLSNPDARETVSPPFADRAGLHRPGRRLRRDARMCSAARAALDHLRAAQRRSRTLVNARLPVSDRASLYRCIVRLEHRPTLLRMNLDLKQLRLLLRLLAKRDVREFEFEDEQVRIRLARGRSARRVAAPTASRRPSLTHGAAPARQRRLDGASDDGNVVDVTSPFVGTFYRSPSPDAPPFVEVGARSAKARRSASSKR